MEPVMPQGAEMLNALATIATSVGLSSALILFFVWWAFKREERMTQRLERLEDFSRTQLVELVKETSAALIQDAEATRQAAKAIEGNSEVIGKSLEATNRIELLLTEHHKLAQGAVQDIKDLKK